MADMGFLGSISYQELYEKDVTYLKRYNPAYYKLTMMKAVRRSGFEERRASARGKKNTAGNTAKLDNSLSRTRSRVRELVLCNEWEWFGTFTLSPEGHDRFDIAEFTRSFSKWIQNINYRQGLHICYLLVPEQHADGAWHMHGVLKGIPDDMLRQFSPRDGVPRNLVKQGFYNWPAYQKKFGFVSLGPIRSLEATANYIGKYITKELAASPIGLNKHLYLCSKGLKRAEVVKKAHIYQPFSPDYSNEHVATKVFESPEAALRLFLCPSDYALPVRFEEVTAAIPRKEVTDYGRHYAPYYPC